MEWKTLDLLPPSDRELLTGTLGDIDIVGVLERQLLASGLQSSTVLAHPGLISLVHWGGDRSINAAQALVRFGYARAALEVESRDAESIRDHLLAEDETNMLAIHYSMGGEPHVLAASLDAVDRASKETGAPYRYSPLLVEPFRFASLTRLVDLDDPHLGNVLVVVSSEYSYMRPTISPRSLQALDNHKVHLVYSEDLGLEWGHFTFLDDVRKDAEEVEPKERRSQAFFKTVAALLLLDCDPATTEQVLALAKIQYALEDGRPLASTWIDTVRPLAMAESGFACRP